MSSDQVKVCRSCDFLMKFSEDYCPRCGAYEGVVRLLDDRGELPGVPRGGTLLGWLSRILVLAAMLSVLWALVRS